ncbi:MAG: DUF4147 domain-containing protein [Gammaproteobacteria bacterium]
MSSTKPDGRSDSAPRERLLGLFRDALLSVRADRLIERALHGADYSHVIALGKAGEALAAGAVRALGTRLVAGFLSAPRGYATGELPDAAPFERHWGAHPLPDTASIAAGEALARFVESLPASASVAVLLSGGASACIELPNLGIDVEFLRRANAWLLASGLPIEDMNRVRVGFSRLKGGGVARLLGNREIGAWILCDVPGGELGWVGSGPLSLPSPREWPSLPDWLRERLCRRSAAGNVPLIRLNRLAGNEEAVAYLVRHGARAGDTLSGEAAELGTRIGAELAAAEPGLYVRGGEPAVRLPALPGRGGRCQHLALTAALAIEGRCDCWLLVAGSDGRDGTEPVAGACVDGGTVVRGRGQGLDPEHALATADAGSFLAASGDLVYTGPTGTHVNDLLIALKTGTVNKA